MIVLGEGEVDGLLVPSLHVHQLLLEAGDEGVGAQGQLIALGSAAVKGHAVLGALVVDDHAVPHGGSPLHRLQTGGAVHVLLKLTVHGFLGDGGQDLVGLQAFILLQGDHGTNGHSSLHGKALLAHFGDFHLGRGHGIQTLLLNGLGAGLGIEFFNGVFIEHPGAVHALDHLTGGLALTEPGDRDAGTVLAVGLLQAGLKFLLTHFDGQLDLVFLFVFDNALDIHVLFSSCETPFFPCGRAQKGIVLQYI